MIDESARYLCCAAAFLNHLVGIKSYGGRGQRPDLVMNLSLVTSFVATFLGVCDHTSGMRSG